MTESIMSRNFVHHGNGGSEYTDAMLAAQRARSSMATRQMSILTTGRALVDALPSDATYAEISREGRKAARLMEEEKDASTYEVSERNLDEQKEEIEERAEAAMNGEEEQNALSTDAATENGDAEATDAESEEQTASAEVKTAEELMAEQQTTETQSQTTQTPLHIVV
ncbi:hypothetical protein [uncultured Desulfovibrio sp.]|uniref:hypothetical protein n=1 Tax=uncultured Desulfovibrio sp. TaxID=167968 RepID=UPI0026110A4A|nr:hypothetical protein [uncultured Desulfovibrio sp.]